jgi:hypothetical protein
MKRSLKIVFSASLFLVISGIWTNLDSNCDSGTSAKNKNNKVSGEPYATLRFTHDGNDQKKEALSVVKELPDPFLTENGTRIETKDQWIKQREILSEYIMRYEYGHVPPPSPVVMINNDVDSVIQGNRGIIRKKTVTLVTGPKGSMKFKINLFLPEKGDGPYPTIVDGDLCWGSLLKRLNPDGLISLVKRNYIIVEFDRTNFAPDKNIRNEGVFPLYPDYDWGVLAAWAWGFHRTIDYLVTQKIVDRNRIIVTGWSRGGKACLLAGALDNRIALTAPNCSGTCGSGPIRFVEDGGEKIDDIVARFPYWFNDTFRQFTGENRFKLPFDQHTLIALVAPRAYLSTNGLKDTWANPKGTAQAHQAAKEVFKMLGDETKAGIFYANSGHDHNLDKWVALLDFADMVFYGKKSDYDYSGIPFSNLDKAYSWSAPVLK